MIAMHRYHYRMWATEPVRSLNNPTHRRLLTW
jgi:hypothetical protein